MIESLSSSATGGDINGHLGHYAFKLDHPQQLLLSKDHFNQEKMKKINSGFLSSSAAGN